METNEQSKSQYQLKHIENHWDITKLLGFPDGNVEKNEQYRSQQQLKHIENHWNTTKTLGFPDGNVEKNEQNRSQQQLKYIENHWDITKTLGFPDGNVEKSEQNRSQQQLKYIENYWDITKTLGFPDGNVEKNEQITTATKTDWESLRYHNTGIPRWRSHLGIPMFWWYLNGSQWDLVAVVICFTHFSPRSHLGIPMFWWYLNNSQYKQSRSQQELKRIENHWDIRSWFLLGSGVCLPIFWYLVPSSFSNFG